MFLPRHSPSFTFHHDAMALEYRLESRIHDFPQVSDVGILLGGGWAPTGGLGALPQKNFEI